MYYLISCDDCGTVFDLTKIDWKFPKDIYLEDGSIDKTKGVGNDYKEDFVPYIICPVCGEKLTK